MRRILHITLFMLFSTILISCYNSRKPDFNAIENKDSLLVTNDSISSYNARHYGIGYNFIVHNDSLLLIVQQPDEHISLLVKDTIYIKRDIHVAVSDIRVIPHDSIDSIWVQIVSETAQTGWIHEKELLPNVVPTGPISQFIMMFSDIHVMLALIFVVIITVAYITRLVQRRHSPLVHFRDIPSFYPTLLCITVAASATFYASLQMFGADIWQHFYYHPSLNPFAMPLMLSIFIFSVWAILIISIAAIEDVRTYLNFEDMVLYLSGLLGVCAVNYIVFSISTLYYIGYPLLIVYCWFAITHYMKNFRQHYICGNCEKRIRQKGVCPHCGAINE